MCYSCLYYPCSCTWICAHIDQESVPSRTSCCRDCWNTLDILCSRPSFSSSFHVFGADQFLICHHFQLHFNWKFPHCLQSLQSWTESLLLLSSCALLVLPYSRHIRFVHSFEFSILYLQLLLFVHPFTIYHVLNQHQTEEVADWQYMNSKWAPDFYPKRS